jgi:hypothetical protein
MHGTSTNKQMDDLAARANTAWRQSVKSVIECGRILIEAKKKVGHGNWLKFVEKLDFTASTAERLMLIASNPVLSNSAHVQNLPRSWGTLHRLTEMEQSDLEALLKDGTINSETERKDVDELIARLNKRGIYEYDDIVSTLATLNKFMTKWPDLNDGLVDRVCDRITEVPKFIDPDDAAELDDIPKICMWLSKLHHTCGEVQQRRSREDLEQWDREDREKAGSKKVNKPKKDVERAEEERIKREVKQRK